jgi:integrase
MSLFHLRALAEQAFSLSPWLGHPEVSPGWEHDHLHCIQLWLQKYIGDRKLSGKLFPITARNLSIRINTWAKKAGVPQIHTHSFRHKFATDLLLKGANLRTVQELLGHTSLSVTERYLAVTDQNKAWVVGLLDGSSIKPA